MGKELENIILENTELLETKYVLCYHGYRMKCRINKQYELAAFNKYLFGLDLKSWGNHCVKNRVDFMSCIVYYK